MRKLETERLVIRNFCEIDAEGAHSLFSDYDAMRLLGMLPAYEKPEESADRVKRWSKYDERLAVVTKENGKFVGYIAVNPDSEEDREDTRELGFGVVESMRRNGYMREAVLAVIDMLRAEGIKYVWACCFKENSVSEAFIRKLGFDFIQEGTYDADNDKEYESLEFRMTL